MKLAKEEFNKQCKNEIQLMSNVSELSFDECAESLFAAFNGFEIENISKEELESIIDKLNAVDML